MESKPEPSKIHCQDEHLFAGRESGPKKKAIIAYQVRNFKIQFRENIHLGGTPPTSVSLHFQMWFQKWVQKWIQKWIQKWAILIQKRAIMICDQTEAAALQIYVMTWHAGS